MHHRGRPARSSVDNPDGATYAVVIMAMPNASSATHRSHRRLSELFDEAWQHARRRWRRLIVFGLAATGVAAIIVLAQHNNQGPRGGGIPAGSHLPISLRVARSVTGIHDRIVVTITAGHTTGVFGKVRRGYSMEAQSVRPQVACVNNRSGYFPNTAIGGRVRAALDPAQGDGGPLGWCPGLYRGTVSFIEGFNCASVEGSCLPPAGFPHRSVIVARFSYRVH